MVRRKERRRALRLDGRRQNLESTVDHLPGEGGFSFTPTDGVYWFKVCTVDRPAIASPTTSTNRERSKISVDTLRPRCIVKAERQGENIVVFWELQELNPDLKSFKLEYKTPDGFWYPVTITPAMVGQQSFRSPHNGPLKVKMTVSDLAGNQTPVEADIGGLAGEASNLTTTSMQVQTNTPGSPATPDPAFPPVVCSGKPAPHALASYQQYNNSTAWPGIHMRSIPTYRMAIRLDFVQQATTTNTSGCSIGTNSPIGAQSQRGTDHH